MNLLTRIARHLEDASRSRMMLIVGTGRSGTHWVARILDSHEDVRATIETNPGFRWATRMALDPSARDRLFPRLAWYYRLQHYWSAPRHYVDKSHPNLWIVERLADTFGDALFLGIERNPYATVASMLRHRGVQKWHRRWRDFPVPNPFLGIAEEDARRYDSLGMAEKCAMRWKAHHEKMREAKAALGERLLIVEHEVLVRRTRATIRRIQDFMGLDGPIPVADADPSTLYKWQTRLSPEQVEAIRRVAAVDPEEVTGERAIQGPDQPVTTR